MRTELNQTKPLQQGPMEPSVMNFSFSNREFHK